MLKIEGNTIKFIQIVLAILIALGLFLIFSQGLWLPKVVNFQLEQEGLIKYYSMDI